VPRNCIKEDVVKVFGPICKQEWTLSHGVFRSKANNKGQKFMDEYSLKALCAY
jgi:hypothetical protein